MLDTGRVNGQTIYALNIGIDPRKCKSFEFGIGLARGLVLPLIESRPLTGLKIFIQRKMSFMLKSLLEKFQVEKLVPLLLLQVSQVLPLLVQLQICKVLLLLLKMQ